ncbi:Chlorophyll a-b binding protein 7 [Picochlorum sp. SENEW3]|nr:Chlorophyll a-b binding protein 7 [Picochlorum sp. SENEW3]
MTLCTISGRHRALPVDRGYVTGVNRGFKKQPSPRARIIPHGFSLESIPISKDVIGLCIFSAAPFVLVQAFADSEAGKQIFERLKNEKPMLERQRVDVEKERARVRMIFPWYGADRPLWVVGNQTPPWLDGTTYPGDYGFDPLKLGANRDDLERYFELEILHARWAMLGALGAMVPEFLDRFTSIDFPEPRWWNVGAYKLQSNEDLNYFGIEGLRIAGNQGVLVIFLCQILLMFGPEYARSRGREALEPLGIFLPGDKNYPGGWLFDPCQLSKDPQRFEIMKVREMKHGRLAMVVWLVWGVQAACTKQGMFDWIQ